MGASRIRPALSLLAAVLLLAGCRSLPTAGTGDVAFRLLWQGTSDLDLKVRDPHGDYINFGTREVESGGRLDVDCNGGTAQLCARPIENVFWPEGTAPGGTYRVWVRAHAIVPEEAPLPCELLVLEGEEVRVRVAGRLLANGDRLGPFTLELPARGSPGWRLRPFEEPPPDEGSYRRMYGRPPPPAPPLPPEGR